MSCGDFFLAFIAIFFPPIAVWIKSGICTGDSLINLALCCLGYLPGLLHAWYIIATNPEYDQDYEPVDNEQAGDRVTYYYVSHSQGAATPILQQQQQHGRMNYGSTANGQSKPSRPQNGLPASSSPPPQTNTVASGSNGNQHARGGETAPPTYDDAIKGDHKIQRDD